MENLTGNIVHLVKMKRFLFSFILLSSLLSCIHWSAQSQSDNDHDTTQKNNKNFHFGIELTGGSLTHLIKNTSTSSNLLKNSSWISGIDFILMNRSYELSVGFLYDSKYYWILFPSGEYTTWHSLPKCNPDSNKVNYKLLSIPITFSFKILKLKKTNILIPVGLKFNKILSLSQNEKKISDQHITFGMLGYSMETNYPFFTGISVRHSFSQRLNIVYDVRLNYLMRHIQNRGCDMCPHGQFFITNNLGILYK